MAAAMAVAERWCDRGIEYQAAEVTDLYRHCGRVARLWRYPIETVATVTVDGDAVTDYTILADRGSLLLDGSQVGDVVQITYEAGYQVADIPADLELALWSIFDSVLQGLSGEGGFSDAIRGAVITGVGTINYDTAAATGPDGEPEFIGPAAQALLAPYRRVSA